MDLPGRSYRYIIVIVMVALLLLAMLTSLLSYFTSTEGITKEWWSGWLLNLSTEMVGAIVTIILIDIVVRAAEKRKESQMQKTQLTIALHNEFQSIEMLKARIGAEKVLVENGQSKQPLNSWQLYRKLNYEEDRKEDWLNVSRTLHFYEQLGKLQGANKLDNELTIYFFRSYLQEMFQHEYLGQLARSSAKTNWGEPILNLAKWMGIENDVPIEKVLIVGSDSAEGSPTSNQVVLKKMPPHGHLRSRKKNKRRPS